MQTIFIWLLNHLKYNFTHHWLLLTKYFYWSIQNRKYTSQFDGQLFIWLNVMFSNQVTKTWMLFIHVIKKNKRKVKEFVKNIQYRNRTIILLTNLSKCDLQLKNAVITKRSWLRNTWFAEHLHSWSTITCTGCANKKTVSLFQQV